MIFAALDEAASKGELLLVEGGLCRYHARRDGTVTIRELLVLPACRGRGIGRSLVQQVQHRHPAAALTARCPVESQANGFWQSLGFELTSHGDEVNLWRRNPG